MRPQCAAVILFEAIPAVSRNLEGREGPKKVPSGDNYTSKM